MCMKQYCPHPRQLISTPIEHGHLGWTSTHTTSPFPNTLLLSDTRRCYSSSSLLFPLLLFSHPLLSLPICKYCLLAFQSTHKVSTLSMGLDYCMLHRFYSLDICRLHRGHTFGLLCISKLYHYMLCTSLKISQ